MTAAPAAAACKEDKVPQIKRCAADCWQAHRFLESMQHTTAMLACGKRTNHVDGIAEQT